MQRHRSAAVALLLGLSAQHVYAAGSSDELVYIGTFTFKPPTHTDGAASARQGIYGARLDARTGHLTPLGLEVELKRASWLTMNPSLPIVYSVAQTNSTGTAPTGPRTGSDSAVISFAVDPSSGALKRINQVDANGRDATHMTFDSASQTLLVANHGSGNVVALPVLSDGSLGPSKSEQSDYGTGPTARQKSPAPHGVAVDPSHHYVAVADFAADRIFLYRFDPGTRALTPAATPFVQLPPGSGPRRVLFDPGDRFVYLANELTGELFWYRWDSHNGALKPLHSLSPYAEDYSGEKSSAEIALSADGRFLYQSLRGNQEAIITYAIDKASGGLTEIQRIPVPGKTPWSFGIDPTGHWMVVADQGSNSVNVVAIDKKSGKLTETDQSVPVPSPVTIAFYRD